MFEPNTLVPQIDHILDFDHTLLIPKVDTPPFAATVGAAALQLYQVNQVHRHWFKVNAKTYYLPKPNHLSKFNHLFEVEHSCYCFTCNTFMVIFYCHFHHLNTG